VNGEARALAGAPESPLDALLRRSLGLKSVLHGCESGSCGACRVLVDGELVASCTYPLERLREGAVVETAEGLQAMPRVRTVLRAFVAERDTRCALCVGGLGVAAAHLERRGLAHDEAAVDRVVAAASCACTGRGSLARALLTP
jgi:aerobic-type carbon monoxide dehydrogenase small subunit (CoxS/CutS family)